MPYPALSVLSNLFIVSSMYCRINLLSSLAYIRRYLFLNAILIFKLHMCEWLHRRLSSETRRSNTREEQPLPKPNHPSQPSPHPIARALGPMSLSWNTPHGPQFRQKLQQRGLSHAVYGRRNHWPELQKNPPCELERFHGKERTHDRVHRCRIGSNVLSYHVLKGSHRAVRPSQTGVA